MILKAPFPYFGGKSKIASLIWDRFGKVDNYVEPFFGSGAVLLARPHPGHTETVNDIDALLSNFWRALAADPVAVSTAADWPVNEVDLHARHRYLRDRRGWVEELMTDPNAYDAELAGWWVWGISQWIGSGWCPPAGVASLQMPHLSADGMYSHSISTQAHDLPRKRPAIGGRGKPSSVGGIHRKIPELGSDRGNDGRHDPSLQIPELGSSRGDVSHDLNRRMPHVSDAGTSNTRSSIRDTQGLYVYLAALSARLRRVRVCCGDWRRVIGPSVTFRHGMTAVFLDPPYPQEGRADVYAHEDQIFADVRQWAIENGGNPLLRIAICGYDFDMPEGWDRVRWKAHGGYGGQGNGRGRENAKREVVWFSPSCLNAIEDLPLFASLRDDITENDTTLFDLMEADAQEQEYAAMLEEGEE